MATISDIAARAGVSRALVSRVINGKSGVSPETRAKIHAVMEELGYRPNSLARSLALQRTQTIGVVMDSLCFPFFFSLIYGLQATAEQLGYNILFCSGGSEALLKSKYIDYFSSGRADGVIVYGSHVNDQPILQSLADHNDCFVLIEGNLPGAQINNLLVDNVMGAYRATERLVQSGCRSIVHVAGDMDYQVSRDRLEGFRRAMQEHSLPINAASVIGADFTAQAGYEAMQSMLGEGALPDGIFFGADRTAYGAMRALAEHGIRSPDDIALIGFDDDAPPSWAGQYPALSTMRQPLYDLGVDSVRLLVQTIEDPQREKVVRMYEPELVIRETCP